MIRLPKLFFLRRFFFFTEKKKRQNQFKTIYPYFCFFARSLCFQSFKSPS